MWRFKALARRRKEIRQLREEMRRDVEECRKRIYGMNDPRKHETIEVFSPYKDSGSARVVITSLVVSMLPVLALAAYELISWALSR